MPFGWRGLFSGRGRVDRTAFWTVQLLLAVFNACVQATVLMFEALPTAVFALILMIASAVVGVLNLAKRLHDLGRSGWWMLAAMAISLGIVGAAVMVWGRGSQAAIASEGPAVLVLLAFILTVGVLRGNPGSNRFGEPPKPRPASAPGT